MNRRVLWECLSPVYTMHDGGWYDPPEEGRDVLYVWARTKSRARTLAVQSWRRRERFILRRNERPLRRATGFDTPYCWRGDNPFAGVRVERMKLAPGWAEGCKRCDSGVSRVTSGEAPTA